MRRTEGRCPPAALGAILAGVLLLAIVPLGGCGEAHKAARQIASGEAAGARGLGAAKPAPSRQIADRPASASAGGYPESREVRRLIALGKPIYCAARRGNEVALTFDDGPGPYTRLVLAKLRKHHLGATFFLVGRNIQLNPVATLHERALGAVGDHTFTHPFLTALVPSATKREIANTQALLARASGGPVFLFRPPYGAHNATIDRIVRAHGLLQILWTVDSADSLGADYAQVERNVIGGLQGGAIILMHENHGQTIRALPRIFAALKRKHLRAVSVPQLLTDDPPSLAQVRAGDLGCAIHTRAARRGWLSSRGGRPTAGSSR